MQMKRKRMALFAAVALSALLLLGACGVPQEDLDAAQAELAAAEAEVAATKSQLSSAQDATMTAAAERDQALADLEVAGTELSLEQDSTSRLRGYLSSANAETALVREELSSASADLESVTEELASVSEDLAAALVAVPEEEAATDEEAATEEAAGPVPGGAYNYVHPAELSFAGSAAEEVSEDWNASFQHPDDFSGDFSGIAYTPSFGFGLTFTTYLAADYDTFEAALLGDGLLSGIEIANLYDTVLADGTPASLAEFTANTDTYDFNLFSIGAVNDDNWVVIHVRGWGEYDEAYMAEIVHTLTLTGERAAAVDAATEEAAADTETAASNPYGYEHPAAVSFTPVDVTVDDYSFSFQHPVDLIPAGAGIAYEAGNAAGLWGLWLDAAILVADAATFEDALIATGMLDLEIRDVWDTTLADGTPAFLADYTATLTGYGCSGVAIGVPSGDNWIMIFTWRWPIGDPDPVDVELVHTLTLQ